MESDLKSRERRSARFWSMFLLALMSVNLLMALIAIVVAVGDPSFKPVPSYGEHAVDWETRKRLQAQSDALGWTVRAERSESNDGIEVTLVDSLGDPVAGARGTLQAYHFTRADQATTVPLTESTDFPGRYFAKVNAAKHGRWQLAVQLTRGKEEQFLWDQTVEWYR
jgi:nitrogen fixation protein FixH